MIQAITVTYKMSSNGAPYMVAKCFGGKFKQARDYSIDANDQSDEMAAELAYRLNWVQDCKHELHGGRVSEDAVVYVLVPKNR